MRFAAALLVSFAAGPAFAGGLTSSDVATTDRLLGPGVLGAEVPSGALADAPSLLPLQTTTWEFRMTSGPRQGDAASDVLQRGLAGGPPVWLYSADDVAIYTLQRTADGSILSPSERDLGEGVTTRFDPPRPLLLQGARPGVARVSDVDVKVYGRGDAKTPAHTGKLTLTYTYLGRYRVTVPAGTYTAALFKMAYTGQVGPASVTDTEYWFLADDVGPVAVVDRQKISAFLVYNEKTKSGRILTSAPE